jgi:hypothetical protein
MPIRRGQGLRAVWGRQGLCGGPMLGLDRRQAGGRPIGWALDPLKDQPMPVRQMSSTSAIERI